MKNSIIALALIAIDGVVGGLVCGPDACGGDVTGSGLPVALITRSFDCQSFLDVTTTPPPSTVIATSYGSDWAETPSPTSLTSSIPAYASDCADDAAYSSACICGSITGTTVAAPTPTVILYVNLPSCLNPGTSTDGFANALCGDSCGICISDASGDGWCVSDGSCTEACTANSQCPSGVCFVNTFCGNTCYDPTADNVNYCEPTSAWSLFPKSVTPRSKNSIFGDIKISDVKPAVNSAPSNFTPPPLPAA